MREQKEATHPGSGREGRESATMRDAALRDAAAGPSRESESANGNSVSIGEVDQAIRQVEQLYRSLTGQDPPAGERPFAPIPPEREPNRYVEEQMDRLLGMIGSAAPQPQSQPQFAWTPPLMVWEGARESVICLELAGATRDEVEVQVAQNLLIVSGRRSQPKLDGEEYQLRVAERPLGPFRRVVMLPPTALVEQMNATMRDGLLEVRIPRATRAGAPQTIPIK